MSPNVELHVEELMLHGFSPADRARIGEALECELARLFAGKDIPSSLTQGGEMARLDGGAFELASGSKAEAVGGQVARAVYGGLSR